MTGYADAGTRLPGVGVAWLRQDLRLHDQPALAAAARHAEALVVAVDDPADDAVTRWGFVRVGRHRRAFRDAALADLATQLTALGGRLHRLRGDPVVALPSLAAALAAARQGRPDAAVTVYAEALPAPEEQAQEQALQDALRAQGARLQTHPGVWLVDPQHLPMPLPRLPQVFTPFRQAVERAGAPTVPPLPVPAAWPGLDAAWPEPTQAAAEVATTPAMVEPRSAFPYHRPDFDGGERAALGHLARYLASGQVAAYKRTRDGLIGTTYSSKFSPWLATGALSVRQVVQGLKALEAREGPSEGSHWLWVELLWRDYFRWLVVQHGARLFWPRGLQPPQAQRLPHHAPSFQRWCEGRTGHALVDAGMRELAASGYLSNRMRQIVASYLIHDLRCDWRAGAAWFESQLLDHDVHSNHGNWLYIAGLGTDPRGGRRFDPDKQAATHDPEGRYRALWLN